VVYPNGVGFSSNHIFAIEDLELRRMVLRIYNDFFVDLHTESNGRLLPQAILPIWDMEETLAEVERLMDAGIRGFTLSDRPEMLGLGELNHPYFAPMWSLFNESGAVANFHIAAGRTRDEMESGMSGQGAGSSSRRVIQPGETVTEAPRSWSSFSAMRALAVSASQSYVSNLRIITNLCMSDMFDKYPKLRVVSAESGIGWIPFLLESMEWQYDEMIAADERDYTKRRPTEYFHDHIYVMFWFEQFAPQTMVELVGVDNILVETDVPHPTCLYPDARRHFDKVLAGWDDHTRRRILRDNAAELYRVEG
jgi:predicted TIM-barrel fold metal-dependent hydrolase